jgi:fibro-slime domain-containing protein
MNSRRALTAATLMICSLGVVSVSIAGEAEIDAFARLSDTLELTAIIRDFKGAEESGGHPDFQAYKGSTTVGIVEPELGPDGVPVVASLRGQRIVEECTDAEGRPINPALYDPDRGDSPGVLEPGVVDNGVTSEASFAQWYRNTPGVNVSTSVPLRLTRVAGTDRYVFDSAHDEPYASIGGFFPIDDRLVGEYGSNGHNFHFTTEVRTRFTYRKGTGQIFHFTGDDDVWVFINGRLAIDLGGLHSKKEQYLELDRLDYLTDAQACTLDIFHAERRTTQSNFRMETTIQLRRAELPNTCVLRD